MNTVVSNKVTIRTGPTFAADASVTGCRVPAGFDRDDLGGHRPHPQGGRDAGDHGVGRQPAVQQQNVNELFGAIGVAVDPAGGGPERVMRGRECSLGAGIGQGGRAR